MRNGSEMLRSILKGSFDHHWSADLYYNGERRMQDVPIADVRFNEDANARIQQSGSCTVVWSDDFATSIIPTTVLDSFAPFGAQLQVFSIVELGSFQERVPYGWFQITNVPEARDEQMRFRGDWITVGATVELELKELLAPIAEETFDVPTAPTSLVSTWDEIGRISGYVLNRTVADVPIPRTVMYDDNKLDAIYDLMTVNLSADPHMNADGTLGARPRSWPEAVDRIPLDVIVEVGSTMSASQVYNRVVVRANGSDSAAILAISEVTTGPLRVRNPDGSRSPFGARTKYLSSEYVTTKAKARKWADDELALVSKLRTQIAPVTEVFNPLRERGDVVLIQRPSHWLIGRVVTIDRDEATQSLTVEVAGTTNVAAPETFFLFGDATFFGDGVYFGGDI